MMIQLLVVILLTISVTPVWATTYYTDKSGSDANSCATAATASSDRTKAKLTIGRSTGSGGTGCLVAGDTLIVGDGTYTEGEIVFETSGTAQNPITIQAENQLSAIVDTTSHAQCSPAFSMYASYITIDGLAVTTNAGSSCGSRPTSGNAFVRCWNSQIPTTSGPSTTGYTNCTVRNMTFADATSKKDTGIKVNQDNGLVEFNTVASSIETFNNTGTIVRYNTVTRGDAWGDHLYGKGGIRNNEFHHNYVAQQNGRGLMLGGNSSCCLWDPATAYECIGSSAHHNVVKYEGTGNAYTMGMTASSGCVLYNNTVIDGAYFLSPSSSFLPNVTNLNPIFKNNIQFRNTSNACVQTSEWTQYVTNLTIDYNNFYNCTSAPSQTHAFAADPLFTNSAGGDYSLTASSTMLNAGVNVGYAYNGSAPEIGAFEALAFSSCQVAAGTPTVVNITFENNLNPPLLPASSVTGFSAREDTVAKTVSSVARNGTNQMDVTVSSAFSSGTAIDFSYSGGNVTDSALMGNTTNQPLLALTNQTCANNISGVSYAWTQSRFAFYSFYGTESGSTRLPAAGSADNVNKKIVPGGKIALRLKINCTGGDCPGSGFLLQYSKNGGAYAYVPDAFDAGNIKFIGIGTIANVPDQGTTTTERLTSDYASNVSGVVIRSSTAIPTFDFTQDSEGEALFYLQLDTDAAESDYYDFKLVQQDGTAITVSQTPRLTVTLLGAGVP